jgi:glycosyltransferase involved in cell wall biosynthesis
MGVYNSASTVVAAVESILGQSFADFEFLIVNDGSSDQTLLKLSELAARDQRIRLIDQENQGLTRSLIHACQMARGEFIARQDADDISHPDRLAHQMDAMQKNADVVLVGSWVEDLTPEGIQATIHSHSKWQLDLPDGTQRTLTGVLAHGSVLMRRAAFENVGGYRSCFYYAQDGDLWLRLSRQGRFLILPEVLYSRVITPGSISSRCRQEQTRFTELSRLAWFAEENAQPIGRFIHEAELLAEQCRRTRGKRISRYELATSHLLLASSLRESQPTLMWKYLWMALKAFPFHPPTLKALLLIAIR